MTPRRTPGTDRCDGAEFPATGIVGGSEELRACLRQVEAAAAAGGNLLICGETGSGKGLFATAVHRLAGACQRPFRLVDCRALSEGEACRRFGPGSRGVPVTGGTLFLDEVSDLEGPVQKLLLHWLQGRAPVAGRGARLIAATCRDLDRQVRRGAFRSDLLDTLRQLVIEVPPLRQRRSDIPLLSAHLLQGHCQAYRLGRKDLSTDLLGTLQAYPWPGNVRELGNVLEQTLLAGRHQPVLFARHLPNHVRVRAARQALGPAREHTSSGDPAQQRRQLRNLMARYGNDLSAACLSAGLTPSRLYGLLKEHQLYTP